MTDWFFFTNVRDYDSHLWRYVKENYLAQQPAATADILATSTAADEDTPLPSGTVEETWKKKIIS